MDVSSTSLAAAALWLPKCSPVRPGQSWPAELTPDGTSPGSPSSRTAVTDAAGLRASTCPVPRSALLGTMYSIRKWELTMEEIRQSEGFNIKYLYSKGLSSFVSHRVGK